MNKRDKVLLCLIILTLFLSVSAVIFVYLNTNNEVKEQTSGKVSNDNNSNIINKDEYVEPKEENKQDDKIEVNKVIERGHEKYPNFTWLSKENLGKVEFSVYDEKVHVGENLQEVKFTKGIPKYATGILKGGILEKAIVITEKGELYVSPNVTTDNFSIVTGEEKFEKVELNGKVLDATYADKQELYFLLDNGNLVDIMGIEYDSEKSYVNVIKIAHEKYPNFTWLSKQNLGKIHFSVYDGKVHVGENLQEVKFTKGIPKYATGILKGGILEKAIVITEKGELYVSPNVTTDNFSIVTGEEKFEKVGLNGKVLDATYADKQELYFLLDNGNLVDISGSKLQ